MFFFVDRELHKDKTCDKSWLCFGNTFIRMPKASAKHLLEKGLESLILHLTRLWWRKFQLFPNAFFISLAATAEIKEKC